MSSTTNEKELIELKIDGDLKESFWLTSKKFTKFVQIEPEISATSSVKSDFFFTLLSMFLLPLLSDFPGPIKTLIMSLILVPSMAFFYIPFVNKKFSRMYFLTLSSTVMQDSR